MCIVHVLCMCMHVHVVCTVCSKQYCLHHVHIFSFLVTHCVSFFYVVVSSYKESVITCPFMANVPQWTQWGQALTLAYTKYGVFTINM